MSPWNFGLKRPRTLVARGPQRPTKVELDGPPPDGGAPIAPRNRRTGGGAADRRGPAIAGDSDRLPAPRAGPAAAGKAAARRLPAAEARVVPGAPIR